MAEAGAAIVDVGGESTRPGAKPVWEGDEIERVLPAVARLAAGGTAVSIDTRKAAVMEAALGAGAAMVNDVSALTYDERSAGRGRAGRLPGRADAPSGPPETMQQSPAYDRPVLLAVYDWLEARIAAAEAAGIDRRDRSSSIPASASARPSSTISQLLNGLALLHGLGCPIMLGASRKRMIGALSGEAPADRAARRLARSGAQGRRPGRPAAPRPRRARDGAGAARLARPARRGADAAMMTAGRAS